MESDQYLKVHLQMYAAFCGVCYPAGGFTSYIRGSVFSKLLIYFWSYASLQKCLKVKTMPLPQMDFLTGLGNSFPVTPVVSGAFEISDVIESSLFGCQHLTPCAIVSVIVLWCWALR